ncbi:3-hydroxyacyl-ACP dehydratase FabZ [Fervidobacterium thailandense]|uniref:3-hydroxyacyl-[acyl-carrier-protein] dehydratase n=1 Tax=Fervidobacterium thailandense TaxID=1008305 RepID=A0A1E3G0C6_9BACT|nr:3-hydroxyacyl-ACP dehydratase FabZ [Fervidobacterium thailandense]ODN29675.1 beta-hydroxyacyl-ACP dehydratase [Fervidobacterium thailandense]
MLSKKEIENILPHRDPILLVDEVLEIQEDRILAKKIISSDESVLKGHFPEYPIYPGVYIIEGLAQTAGILLLREISASGKKVVPLFLGIDDARFKKEVRPPCELLYDVKLLESKMGVYIVDAKAYVNNSLVAKAKLVLGSKVASEGTEGTKNE